MAPDGSDATLRALDMISVSAMAARSALLDAIGKRPLRDPVLSALETIISTALDARVRRVEALEDQDEPKPRPLFVALDTIIDEVRQLRVSLDRLVARLGAPVDSERPDA